MPDGNGNTSTAKRQTAAQPITHSAAYSTTYYTKLWCVGPFSYSNLRTKKKFKTNSSFVFRSKILKRKRKIRYIHGPLWTLSESWEHDAGLRHTKNINVDWSEKLAVRCFLNMFCCRAVLPSGSVNGFRPFDIGRLLFYRLQSRLAFG